MLQINKSNLTILLLIILTYSYSFQVSGQEKSTKTVSTNFDISNDNNYQYFDINDYEQKTLFKVNMVPGVQLIDSKRTVTLFSAGFETKIFPSLSLGIMAELPYNEFSFNMSAEARYYPSKRKNSKLEKNKVNNFTGNYIGLSYLRDFSFYDLYSYDDVFQLSIGKQHKVGKLGFYDVSAMLSFFPQDNVYQIGFNISAGLAYGSTKSVPKNLLNINNTDINVPRWGKGLISVSSPGILTDGYTYGVGFTLSGEFHLAKYFTLKSNTSITYESGGSYGGDSQAITDLQVRKYFGIQRKLRKGNISPGYTGNYMAIGANYILSNKFKEDFDDFTNSLDTSSPNLKLIYGWQERIGKRFFFDVYSYVGYNTRKSPYNYNERSSNRKIGYGVGTQLGILLYK